MKRVTPWRRCEGWCRFRAEGEEAEGEEVSVTVTTSLPDPCLSPNARVHWRKRASFKAEARATTMLKAYAACGTRPKWKHATVQATFFLRDKRGLEADQDNRIGSLKAHIDGIADAGIIENDRGLTWLPVKHEVDKANPRVEITVTEIEARP